MHANTDHILIHIFVSLLLFFVAVAHAVAQIVHFQQKK